MKKFLSILLSISLLASIVNVAYAAGTVKDISEHVLYAFDYDDTTTSTTLGYNKPECWTSGATRTVTNNVIECTGTGNTENSKGVYFGLTDHNGTNGKSYYDRIPIMSTAASHKILHISYDFTNNLSADANVQLGFNPLQAPQGTSNGRNYIYKFNLSTGVVTSAGGATAEVNCPVGQTVRVNMIMDLYSGNSRLYLAKDKYIENANVFSSSGAYLKSAIFWVDKAVSFNYTITDPKFTMYSADTTMDEVAAYAYASPDELFVPDYIWKYDGVQGSGVASLGWVSASYTGNNTDGYVLTAANSISNATNGAIGRFLLGGGNSSAIEGTTVLHQQFSYEPGTITGNHRFGVRGNNGYEWDLFFDYASKNIVDASGNVFSTWSADKTYEIDYIVDLSTYEFSWLVNGKVAASGSVHSARRPLWQICYGMMNANDSMTLKGITTTLYKSDRTYANVLSENLAKLPISFETDSNGYGDFEVENYEDCFNSAAWRIYENRRLFSSSKALAVISENKTAPADGEDPTLNLSFKANKAGENTYYMWIRHTASVANQSGQNCYLSTTESGSYNTFTFSAEQNAPQWIRLGSVTAKEGDNGYVRIRHRQQNHIAIDRYVITTDANFVPTDAYYGISPAASSTAYKAPAFSNGRTSFEAENTTYNSSVYEKYSSWSHSSTYGSASNYSNSSGLVVSSSKSKTFTSAWETAPDIEFNFTPTTSGSKYLWARIRSTSTNKDIAISVNCSDYTQFSPSVEDEHYWQLIYVIDGAQADLPVNVRLYNVSGGYAFDMFAISESVFDTPTDKITWTTQESILTSPYSAPTVSASAVTAMSHPRIYFTADEAATVKAALSAEENASALTKHNANVARGKKSNFTGSLAVVPGYSNNNSEFLGVIESLAFEYAIKADSEAGSKAVSAVMNYISTVSYAGIESDELTRTAGNDIAVLSKIYDWCYGLLTTDQKNAIIAKCQEIAYQLEIGWPPSNLSAITGFGAEGALQNYLLTFAIAAADERPDIYNYVVGRIEDEYIPARKELYASGESLQGTRYGTYRGQHDLTAALLLSTIGYGNDVYGEGLEDLVNWYIYARRPDGLLFVDGDDTNNGKTAGEYYTVGHMQNAFVIAARLFNNQYIKNEAKEATKNFTTFGYGEGYISPTSFLAINRPSLSATSENGYPLTKYFGYPNGNMIARTGWNSSPSVTDDTAVAFMKSGNVNVSNHQHLDAGNFQLYYKGILANDPIYYTGNNYNSEYINMYAKRSVAHNTVLVRDGVSRSLNGHSVADGGQVPVSSPTDIEDSETVATTEAYDFGGDDVNQPDYSYLKADLTGAYSSDSVNDYNRSFMFLNMYDEESPTALVVFDRLQTKNAGHKTAWLLHGLNTPTINGSRSTFALNANGYTGKMTNDTLLPVNPTITAVEDGYVTAGGTKYNSGYNTSSGGVNESDGYRIEVSPASQSTMTYYLNVIQLSEGDADVISPSLIENDTFVGALVKDRVVLFSKSGDLIGSDNNTEYAFDFTENNGYLCKIAVADAKEGTWEVSYSATGADGSYKVIAQTATNRIGADKGATISFEGTSGYYKLRRVSDVYTSRNSEISEENTIKQLSPSVKVVDNTFYVAPRTYDSLSGVSNGEYNYKQIIAAYSEDEKTLLAVKIIDNFTQTDKCGEYSELVKFDELPEGVVIKTFLFEDLETIEPVTDFGTAVYH